MDASVSHLRQYFKGWTHMHIDCSKQIDNRHHCELRLDVYGRPWRDGLTEIVEIVYDSWESISYVYCINMVKRDLPIYRILKTHREEVDSRAE